MINQSNLRHIVNDHLEHQEGGLMSSYCSRLRFDPTSFSQMINQMFDHD